MNKPNNPILGKHEAAILIDLHKRGILPSGTSIIIPTETRRDHHELELKASQIQVTSMNRKTTITL